MSVIKRKAARELLLEIAARTRAKVFTRVAPTAIKQLEAAVLREAEKIVTYEPSIGKTIRGMYCSRPKVMAKNGGDV